MTGRGKAKRGTELQRRGMVKSCNGNGAVLNGAERHREAKAQDKTSEEYSNVQNKTNKEELRDEHYQGQYDKVQGTADIYG